MDGCFTVRTFVKDLFVAAGRLAVCHAVIGLVRCHQLLSGTGGKPDQAEEHHKFRVHRGAHQK